ncbi:YraN family protein [Candidatus Thiodubiliella endoseptemdiera]|uniref:YraN family protein n=1 Tax=Candidatus Thiodubiliella endoseptemdiera TaxID=2738886 RepID=UPI0034DF3C11
MFSLKRKIGNKAEKLALQYLKKQGLKLIQQNYLTTMGEIDLIMLDKSEQSLVFIEVRYRKMANFGSATDTINHSKQGKIINTAKHFLQKYAQYDDFICRFDVVGLESDLKCPKINWIQNAFEVR